MTSFPLHHCPFFLCRGQQAGSIDEFSGAAVFCLNKALFSTPRVLAQRPNPYQASTRGSLPVVPVCRHTGFWELAGLCCLFNFSSGTKTCPQVNSAKGIWHLGVLPLSGPGRWKKHNLPIFPSACWVPDSWQKLREVESAPRDVAGRFRSVCDSASFPQLSSKCCWGKRRRSCYPPKSLGGG